MNEFIVSLLPKLQVLLLLALLDAIGGGIKAWKTGLFKWELFPQFLQSLSGYLFTWIAMELVGFLPGYLGTSLPQLAQVFAGFSGDAVYAGIIVKYAVSLLGHVKHIKES